MLRIWNLVAETAVDTEYEDVREFQVVTELIEIVD
jgi:hypothetical protein